MQRGDWGFGQHGREERVGSWLFTAFLGRRASVASVPKSYASPLLKESVTVGHPPGSRRVLGGRGLTPQSLKAVDLPSSSVGRRLEWRKPTGWLKDSKIEFVVYDEITKTVSTFV